MVLYLRWFGYAPTLVSPWRFLHRVSMRWVPTTLGLDPGHLPSGSSRTRLPRQVQGTEAKSHGDARDVQGGPRSRASRLGLRGQLGQAVGKGKVVRCGAQAGG